MDLRLILVLCALTATRAASHNGHASDILSGQCASQCKSSELNEYPTAQTHVYKYSTRTLVNSWNTEIDLKSDVLLTRLNNCDYSLELRNVAINGIPDARPWEEKLKARTLNFGWVDGVITDVCHHPEEEDWILNIKKAIVSSLQVVGTSGYVKKVERDVLGDCQTTYQQGELSNDRIVMHKVKDIASCQYHHDDKIASVVNAILAPGKPEYQCKQVWTSKYILKKVECGHVAQAQTEVLANLTMELTKTESGVSAKSLDSFHRDHLHASRVELPKKSVSEVTESLNTLCKTVAKQIKSQAPSAFRDLSNSLETLNYVELKKVWSSLIDGKLDESCSSERVKVMFVDALLQSRTGPALKLLVKDLAKDNYVSEMKLKAALYSLIYKPRPCFETMDAITDLLRSDKAFVQSLFGMTAAIQKYYELTDDKKTVSLALDMLITRFYKAPDEERVILARAMSNVRFDAERMVQDFYSKHIDSGKPEIRVAALEAIELLEPSNKMVHPKLQKIIFSTQQPNEVRVRALKVYLRSADEEEISQLKSHIASHPEDRHFISYADSYLRNALTTMNPDKQSIKEVAKLGLSSWKEPQKTIARNIELSRMTTLGNFGFSYEIDSIVENNQEFPTWVVFNASIPVHRVNEFNVELGLRQEGMEKLATKMLDQINQIKVQDWEKVIKEAKDSRDFKPIVKELTKIVQEIQKLAGKNAKLSVYMKINGITLFYWNGVESTLNQRESLRRFMIENTRTRKAVEASLGWFFVDYRVNSPLASGLTLRYKHEGSMIPGFKVSLKSQSTTSNNNVLSLFPNFAVDFVYGRELVLFKPIASHLVKMNLNSDIAVEAVHTLVESGEDKIHTFVNTAKDEMDILRFEITKMIRDSNGVEVREQSYPGLKQKWCSTEYTEKILGFVLCFDGQEEANAFMHKKNAQIVRRLYAVKTDKSLKTYEVTVKMGKNFRGITLDTPNTDINRKIEIVAGKSKDFKDKTGKFWVSITSPIKSVDVNVSAAFPSGQEWFVELETRVDRKLHSARLDLTPKSNQRTLNLLVNSPLLREKIDYDLTFSSPLEAGNELMAQIHSNTANKRNRMALVKVIRSQQDLNKFAKIEFELNNDRAEKIMALWVDGSIKGSYPEISAFQYNGKVDYRRQKGKMETVQLTGNVKIDTTGTARQLTNNMEVKTTQWPQINGKVAHKMFFKPSEHLENEMELRWGRDYDQDSTLNRIIARQTTTFKTGPKNVEAKTILIGENRAARFNHKVEGQVNFIPRSFEMLKAEFSHSDLNQPENNHKLVIDRKTQTEQSGGTLSITLSSPRLSRNVKASYTASIASPKLSVLVKEEEPDKTVKRGYHMSASANNGPARKDLKFEIVTHPSNEQIYKVEAELNKDRSKANANLKINKKDLSIFNFEHKHDAAVIKSKIVIPKYGSLDVNGDRKEKTYKVIAKDNNEWSHEFSLSNGKTKTIKSTSLTGAKILPTMLAEHNKERGLWRFDIRTNKFDFHSEMEGRKSEPSLKIEWTCSKHQDKHVSEIRFAKDFKKFNSEHIKKGKILYSIEMLEDKKAEEQRKLNIKFGDKYETRVQSVYTPDRSTSKLDVVSTAPDFEAKINSKIFWPVNRRGRFARMSSMEMPKVDIKANIKRDGKESSLVINNDQITKVHVQHRTRSGVPLVVDTKIESDKWTFVGHADQLKWNLVVVPQTDKKSFDLNLEGYGKLAKLNLALEKESSQWKVLALSKLIIDGDEKLNGEFEAKIAQTLIAGPHHITMKSYNQEFSMTYKFEDKLYLTFGVHENGQKLIAANFNGDKYQRNRVLNINGKLELTSEKYDAYRMATYEVKFNRDGRKIEMEVEKKGSNPMTLKLSSDIAREAAKVNAEIHGRTASGKQRKLAIDYNRLNKIDFSVKLFDMSKVDSELGVSIPLVKIAEFIGNEASLHLRSKSLNTEAAFQLKAPSKTSVTGLANLKIQGQQWFQYNLAINDGSSTQFFGSEKVNNQIVNPIAILNDLYFKGEKIFFHHLLISDKLISTSIEAPTLFKVNQAFVSNERTPEVFGKYCLGSTNACTKVSSKWTLGQKGLAEMNIQGPKAQQKYDIYFKWNCEEGKEHGSVLFVKNERKYGYELSRLVKNTKVAVYDAKITLPKREVTITTTKNVETSSDEKYVGQWTVLITPRQNGNPLKITLDRSVKRTPVTLKADYVVTFEHKTLAKPIKLISSVNMIKSEVPRNNLWGIKIVEVKLGLNHEGGESSDLNTVFGWEMADNKMHYKWSIWQREDKINFGCIGTLSSEGSLKENYMNSLRDYTCHWLNRKGERKELKREQKFSMKSLLPGGLSQITFHDNMKNPLGSYFYNGTFHLFEALKDATIDFKTEDGLRYQVQAKLDSIKSEKCFELTLFEVANDAEKRGLRVCLNLGARSGNSVFLFEVINFGKQSKMVDGERKVNFSIKRVKEFANDYLISLIWDTDSMAAASYKAVNAVEELHNKRTAFIAERDAELKAKMDFLRDTFGEKIGRAQKHILQEIDELADEMKPEKEILTRMIRKISRPRRSIHKAAALRKLEERKRVDLTSQMSYDWRVYDIENGHLEMIVRNVEAEKVPLFVYETLLKTSLI